MYTELRNKKISNVGAEFVEIFILNSDLEWPKQLIQSQFCEAMCKFVNEVCKHDGQDYPPNLLKGLVNAIQFYLHSSRVYWILLPKLGGPVVDLYYVVDNLMKDRTRMVMDVVKQSTPISSKMENQMWEKGVLGEDNPSKLVEAVLFLTGVNFAL